LAAVPPAYWPSDPSERITRWQGTTTGSGFRAQAVPTARTALGCPRPWRPGRSSRVPVADVGQVAQHAAPEPVGQPEVQRDVEPVPPAAEVLLQLPGHRVQPGRGPQDARAHRLRQCGQHLVVVLDLVGHPDQAPPGRGQQQRSDWGVQLAPIARRAERIWFARFSAVIRQASWSNIRAQPGVAVADLHAVHIRAGRRKGLRIELPAPQDGLF
jgi:hypothetical protein